MAARRRLRGDSVPALGRPAARPAGRRVLRVDVRLLDDRLVDPDRRRSRRPLAPPLAAVHAVGRRHGDHRARARGAAPAAGRWAAAPRVGDAGTGDRAARRADPHDGAAALAPLHRAHGRARRRPRRCSASSGSTIGWGCSRPSRSPSRRFRPGASCPHSGSLTEFAAATQWVVVVFMVLAGINFALLFRALVRRRWRSVSADQELRLYLGILVVASVGARRRALDRRPRRRARRRSATASSRSSR